MDAGTSEHVMAETGSRPAAGVSRTGLVVSGVGLLVLALLLTVWLGLFGGSAGLLGGRSWSAFTYATAQAMTTAGLGILVVIGAGLMALGIRSPLRWLVVVPLALLATVYGLEALLMWGNTSATMTYYPVGDWSISPSGDHAVALANGTDDSGDPRCSATYFDLGPIATYDVTASNYWLECPVDSELHVVWDPTHPGAFWIEGPKKHDAGPPDGRFLGFRTGGPA